ncbi:hypothetical protein [Streptomyces sp. A012304]|uniref:hypothetical protein n=1 Tax=Streptomyces sp. A012304 TaxID=375446 RepID=UPI00222F3F13|nr:hypothetical protein [Streptomyces sp. A012304]GKQ35166.1 hypothetical protein ALMP_17120 [Streptomyces sp. A012304]
MARRHDRILHRLLYATLIILALMHPDTAGHVAQLAATVLLTTVAGIAQAAAAQPEAALLTAGGIWIAHQIRTHRPTARVTH